MRNRVVLKINNTSDENSCRVNLTDTGVQDYDFGQSKPKAIQDMTEMITMRYLATKQNQKQKQNQQINKLCYKLYSALRFI